MGSASAQTLTQAVRLWKSLAAPPRRAYALAMTNVFVSPERAAFLRERLKKLLAERQAAKANFASICERLASESRSSFGKFASSFEEVVPDFTQLGAGAPEAHRNASRDDLNDCT